MRLNCLLWLAAVAGLLSAPAAHATVYYISPTGSGTAAGTSPAAPWSLAKANASLQPGDVCVVMPGTYGGMIAPANTSATGPRLTYVGNLLDPAAAVFPGSFETFASYLTVKGVKFTGGIQLSGNGTRVAQYDSIAWCHGKTAMFAGSKHNVITRCTIKNDPLAGATVAFVFSGWQDWPVGNYITNSEYDTLSYNDIDLSTINWRGFIMRVFAQRNLIKGNRIRGFFAGTSPDVAGRYLYNSYDNAFEDNRWTFEAAGDSAGSPWDCFALRDSSSRNLFLRDTIFAGLQNGHDFQGRLVNAGTDAWNGHAERNVWRNCFYYMNGYTLYQINGDGTTLDHSVFAAVQGTPMLITTSIGVLTVDHCTFFSGNGRALETTSTIAVGTPVDSVRFTSNLFVSGVTDAASGVVKFPGATGFRSSANVFYTPSFRTTAGDLACNWNGQTGSVAQWCATSGKDCDSRHGDPKFLNAGPTTFDPHLLAGSAAIAAAAAGTDAGAVPFAGAPSDVTPPAAVTDLAAINVADVSLTLQWTAPGDDGMSGQANAYDIRYSTAPIDAANFAAATAAPSPPPPIAAGSAQSYVLLGLTAQQTYYFALKTQDGAGNWSGLSNLPAATTIVVDRTPPAAVTDLSGH